MRYNRFCSAFQSQRKVTLTLGFQISPKTFGPSGESFFFSFFGCVHSFVLFNAEVMGPQLRILGVTVDRFV